MAVPVSQMWTVASYVLRQKLAGRKRYPLVLMLEPLFRDRRRRLVGMPLGRPAALFQPRLAPVAIAVQHRVTGRPRDLVRSAQIRHVHSPDSYSLMNCWRRSITPLTFQGMLPFYMPR
jgi:hypothetical protein